MSRVLAVVLVAIVAVSCGRVQEFEEGSTEAAIAGWIAEWGGESHEYRGILDSPDCDALDGWENWKDRYESTVPDTPQWRAEQGYAQAIALRRQQLDC